MVVEYNQTDIAGGTTIYERLEAPKRAIIGFLINHDIVDDERQANIVLIVVIIACVAFVVLFNMRGVFVHKPKEPSPEVVNEMLTPESARQ